ncbi:MAG: hypothetical protein P4L84_06065 [Isosphaeraceae bacterium]|nr:hypothetical protein [Isosphaeraceae bacterium]
MTRRTTGLAVALGLGLAAPAAAAPPSIGGTAPLGAQKGTVTEVAINGGNLAGNPQLIAPFPFTLASPAPADSNVGTWKIKLLVDPSTAIGVYPIRVKTDDGLSNPFLFAVGQLPQVAEKEENSTFESAQVVPSPVVVEGQTAGNDVDFFKFPGKKGQKIVVDAQCARIGSGVDPTIRLTTVNHTYVASADDSLGLLTDARLWVVLPEDGDYVVELSDSRYQGGGRPVYRLVIGPVPMAEELFPIGGRQGETVGLELRGGTLPDMRIGAATVKGAPGSEVFPARITNQMLGISAPGEPVVEIESLAPLSVSEVPELREAIGTSTPTRGAAPVVFNGRIDPKGDDDLFVLAVTPGQKLHIEVEAADVGSALDGVLQVLGANNAVLATADDTTIPATGKKGKGAGIVSPDPTLDFTVPAGLNEVSLKLRDLEGRGGTGFPYRIVVAPSGPTFELALNDPQISIPKGGSALVGVTVVRKDYGGPITLNVKNPPAGVVVRPGTIADGQLVGAFSVSAAPDAAFGVALLDVVGEGKGPAGPIVVPAEKAIVFAQQGAPPAVLPTNTVTQHGLAAAPALPTPIVLDAPSAPVEIAHGLGGPVTIKATRTAGADTALAITTLPLPPGVTVPAANIAAKAGDGAVTVNVAPEAPLGLVTVALVAKGKVNNVDLTLAVPAVTLNVVRPASLEMAAPALEVKAGATFELKGKVVRKGPFKEPVTVKINGLPAGLKADPVTVAPESTEFTAKVVADPKAAAATATANVVLAYQVNKKDYPPAPVSLAVKVLPAN